MLDTKVVAESRDGCGGTDGETGEREGEGEGEGGREKLVYVHNPVKTVGEYSVQQPLLPSMNLVRWLPRAHTHARTSLTRRLHSN